MESCAILSQYQAKVLELQPYAQVSPASQRGVFAQRNLAMIPDPRAGNHNHSGFRLFLLPEFAGHSKEEPMKPYQHTVQYYETDRMGITHHSNYIR